MLWCVQVQIDEEFIAFSECREVRLRVTAIQHFSDFGAAFTALGKKLVPKGAATKQDAIKM